MLLRKSNLVMAILIMVSCTAWADKFDEVCRNSYEYYYLRFDKRSGASDASTVQIQCLTGAQRMAEEEPINFDIVELLDQAKVNPDNYRRLMASSMQLACVRNSTQTKGLSYAVFKQSQCTPMLSGTANKAPVQSVSNTAKSAQSEVGNGNREADSASLSGASLNGRWLCPDGSNVWIFDASQNKFSHVTRYMALPSDFPFLMAPTQTESTFRGSYEVKDGVITTIPSYYSDTVLVQSLARVGKPWNPTGIDRGFGAERYTVVSFNQTRMSRTRTEWARKGSDGVYHWGPQASKASLQTCYHQ